MSIKIQSFVYCMRTERTPEGATVAVDVRNLLMLEFLPTAFSFGLVACIVGLDSYKDYTLRYTFVDSRNEIIYDTQNIQVPFSDIKRNDPSGHKIPSEYDGITISLMYNNLILRDKGIYETVVMIDGQEVGRLPIFIGTQE